MACFDVGGTFIKYAVINSDGQILFKDKFPSPNENCREAIPDVISEKTEELKKKFELSGIGISTAGQVDTEKGEISFATGNLPGYTGARLSEIIGGRTGLKVSIENDVNAAALGEMWMGAARGKKTFLCVALGTGVGGAIVIDGKLYRGFGGAAGEVGHIIINENGDHCTCGCSGCYERYASTSALVRKYTSEARNSGKDPGEVNGEIIMEKVHSGEELACRVYDEFLDHIVTGLASAAHLLDPGLIVIGGGISAQGEPFFKEIKERFKKAAIKSYAEYTDIVQAQLQNDAGIFGACYIALQK